MTTILAQERPVRVWCCVAPERTLLKGEWWARLLPPLPLVRLTRFLPRVEESTTPSRVIQTALRRGYGYLDEWMIEKIIERGSKTPGYLVIPLSPNGERSILFVQSNGCIERWNPKAFRFANELGLWSVVMRTP